MAAEKFPAPPGDWSRDNPQLATQLAAFRERYPLYARDLDDDRPDADRGPMEDAWLRWVADGYRKATGRR